MVSLALNMYIKNKYINYTRTKIKVSKMRFYLRLVRLLAAVVRREHAEGGLRKRGRALLQTESSV